MRSAACGPVDLNRPARDGDAVDRHRRAVWKDVLQEKDVLQKAVRRDDPPSRRLAALGGARRGGARRGGARRGGARRHVRRLRLRRRSDRRVICRLRRNFAFERARRCGQSVRPGGIRSGVQAGFAPASRRDSLRRPGGIRSGVQAGFAPAPIGGSNPGAGGGSFAAVPALVPVAAENPEADAPAANAPAANAPAANRPDANRPDADRHADDGEAQVAPALDPALADSLPFPIGS